MGRLLGGVFLLGLCTGNFGALVLVTVVMVLSAVEPEG